MNFNWKCKNLHCSPQTGNYYQKGGEYIMSETYRHGYRFRVYPTDDQKELIEKLSNLYRYAYNWGKSREEKQYKRKKNGETNIGFLSYFDLCREFREFRRRPENAWLQELPSMTALLALRDVVKSFKDFFRRGFGYPRFKSKKRSPKMFKTRNDRFFIDGDQVRFEGLPISHNGDPTSTIDLHHDYGFKKVNKTEYIQPSISVDTFGNYWVSFSVEEPKIELNTPKSEPIGIDVGIRRTMILSTGEIFTRPNDKLDRLNRRLKRAKRHKTRDIKRRRVEAERTKTKYDDIPVSKRAEKRANKVRKLHKKITNVKANWYHNTIKEIVTRNPEAIVIETLHSRDLEKQFKGRTRRSKESIYHADFYTIHEIIQDKCNKYGVKLIKAPDGYQSSQICSNCGYTQNIGRKRIYRCPNCGANIDRDINAALNLRSLALVS